MIFTLLGTILVLVSLYDAFVTILSLTGAGPISGRLSRGLWALLLKCHKRVSIHALLTLAGPVFLILTVVFWYVGLFSGWLMIFSGTTESVVNSDTNISSTLKEKIYFLGVTLSGLGYGDFTPPEFPWTFASTLTAFSGTVLTTLALSYIIAVVPIAIEKRQIAHQVYAFYACLDEMTEVAENEPCRQEATRKLLDLLKKAEGFSHKFVAYPVVGYFHSKFPQNSFHCAVSIIFDNLEKLTHPESCGVSNQNTLNRSLFIRYIDLHLQNVRYLIPHLGGEAPRLWPDYKLDGNVDLDIRKAMLKHACEYDGWK